MFAALCNSTGIFNQKSSPPIEFMPIGKRGLSRPPAIPPRKSDKPLKLLRAICRANSQRKPSAAAVSDTLGIFSNRRSPACKQATGRLRTDFSMRQLLLILMRRGRPNLFACSSTPPPRACAQTSVRHYYAGSRRCTEPTRHGLPPCTVLLRRQQLAKLAQPGFIIAPATSGTGIHRLAHLPHAWSAYGALVLLMG